MTEETKETFENLDAAFQGVKDDEQPEETKTPDEAAEAELEKTEKEQEIPAQETEDQQPEQKEVTEDSWSTLGHPEFEGKSQKDIADILEQKKEETDYRNTLYGNQAVPMGQGFHPDTSPWGFKDIKPKQPDIEKAKKLMKEAGYPNGLDVEFKITPTWGKNDIMAQIVQQMARPAGFRIKITPQVGLQYWRNLRTYNYQMFVFTLPKEDPMNRYYSILHTDPAKPYLGYSYAVPFPGVYSP